MQQFSMEGTLVPTTKIEIGNMAFLGRNHTFFPRVFQFSHDIAFETLCCRPSTKGGDLHTLCRCVRYHASMQYVWTSLKLFAKHFEPSNVVGVQQNKFGFYLRRPQNCLSFLHVLSVVSMIPPSMFLSLFVTGEGNGLRENRGPPGPECSTRTGR